MATENLISTTYLEHVESVSKGGITFEKRYERVIEYGVAVMLSGVSDWLDQPLK